MYAAIIHLHALNVYARRIYYCGMEPGLPITVLATRRHETRPGRRRWRAV